MIGVRDPHLRRDRPVGGDAPRRDGIGGGDFCAASVRSDLPGPQLRHSAIPRASRNRAFYRGCETWRALSHLARKASLTASCPLAKALNLLNPSPAVSQVMGSKNG